MTQTIALSQGKDAKDANIRFEDWEAEQMRDPEFRAAAEELEPVHQVARLCIIKDINIVKEAKCLKPDRLAN